MYYLRCFPFTTQRNPLLLCQLLVMWSPLWHILPKVPSCWYFRAVSSFMPVGSWSLEHSSEPKVPVLPKGSWGLRAAVCALKPVLPLASCVYSDCAAGDFNTGAQAVILNCLSNQRIWNSDVECDWGKAFTFLEIAAVSQVKEPPRKIKIWGILMTIMVIQNSSLVCQLEQSCLLSYRSWGLNVVLVFKMNFTD